MSASQLLFDFGSVDNRIDATDFRGKAADAELRAIKGQIFLDAISAFYEVQRSLLQLRLARENVNSRRAFVEFVRDRADLGASSAADVVRAESRVAEAMDLMSSAAQSLARSQAVYRQYYGKEAQPYALPRRYLSRSSISSTWSLTSSLTRMRSGPGYLSTRPRTITRR